MFLPADDPIGVDDVEALPYVGRDLDGDDADRLARIVAAVNAFLRGLPVTDRAARTTQEDADTDGWPATITEGGVMLAGRLFRRKDSPGGVAVMGDAGPVYVRRNDPDIAMLLDLGEYATPAVG